MTTVKKRLTHEPERVNPIAPVHIWRTPAGSPVDMLVVAHLSAYSAIHQQASSSLPNETGGFLVGRVANDQRDGCWHVEIEQAVPVEPISQNPVHFAFTWRDVDRVRSYREEHGKALLGWYHTHPDLGIFLSETDLERTHRVLFSEPFQIALVYDPVRGRAGYFFWEGAQKIDASPAEWREFDIAVAPELAATAAGSEDPASVDTTSDAAVPGPVAASGVVTAEGLAAPDVAPFAPAAAVASASGETMARPSDTRMRRLRLADASAPDTALARPLNSSRTAVRRDHALETASSTADSATDTAGRARSLMLFGVALVLVGVVVLYLWLSLY